MSTDIKILHASCCAKNSQIKKQIEEITSKNNMNVSIEEFSKIEDTMKFGTMVFPSIVVNGKVYDYRTHNSEEKLLSIL
ncbi:thioredoxin family protein [uncultured Tenacibaculum sp.]|uniref:thioredoxin family protein n=1 Tax=uncultured Tenacibaculum sp. TaxID=174713 RepID=UPI0026102E9C|nr:thioredoxin family protein [uncultured Tenacibaculum sp.]